MDTHCFLDAGLFRSAFSRGSICGKWLFEKDHLLPECRNHLRMRESLIMLSVSCVVLRTGGALNMQVGLFFLRGLLCNHLCQNLHAPAQFFERYPPISEQ